MTRKSSHKQQLEVDFELSPVVPDIHIKAATLKFLVNTMIKCFGGLIIMTRNLFWFQSGIIGDVNWQSHVPSMQFLGVLSERDPSRDINHGIGFFCNIR